MLLNIHPTVMNVYIDLQGEREHWTSWEYKTAGVELVRFIGH